MLHALEQRVGWCYAHSCMNKMPTKFMHCPCTLLCGAGPMAAVWFVVMGPIPHISTCLKGADANKITFPSSLLTSMRDAQARVLWVDTGECQAVNTTMAVVL